MVWHHFGASEKSNDNARFGSIAGPDLLLANVYEAVQFLKMQGEGAT